MIKSLYLSTLVLLAVACSPEKKKNEQEVVAQHEEPQPIKAVDAKANDLLIAHYKRIREERIHQDARPEQPRHVQ